MAWSSEFAGPGSQPWRIFLRRSCGLEVLQRSFDWARQFGVGEQRGAELSKFWESRAQIRFGDVGTFRDATGDEETLEAEDAGIPQRAQFALVARDDAAPETYIDPQLLWRCGEFFAIGGYGGCRGDAVQRHLDQRRHAAGGCGLRCAGKTFPIGAAGLVDVDVRVDNAWHYGGFDGFVHRQTRGKVVEG